MAGLAPLLMERRMSDSPTGRSRSPLESSSPGRQEDAFGTALSWYLERKVRRSKAGHSGTRRDDIEAVERGFWRRLVAVTLAAGLEARRFAARSHAPGDNRVAENATGATADGGRLDRRGALVRADSRARVAASGSRRSDTQPTETRKRLRLFSPVGVVAFGLGLVTAASAVALFLGRPRRATDTAMTEARDSLVSLAEDAARRARKRTGTSIGTTNGAAGEV
jgi:hypothetical protein